MKELMIRKTPILFNKSSVSNRVIFAAKGFRVFFVKINIEV